MIKGVNGTPIEDTETTQFAVPTVDGRLDMVIAFDTTGSMARYIDDVRNQVSELVPRLFKANQDLKLGIVAFGDYCDMVDAETFGDAYHGLPWYKQLSEVTGGVSVPFRSDNKTAELIEAASLSRGGRRSREMFSEKVMCCMAAGDSEMSSVYGAYAKVNKKKRAEDLGVEESELPF